MTGIARVPMAITDSNRASRAASVRAVAGDEAAHLRQGVVEDVGQAVAVLDQVLDGVEPATAFTMGGASSARTDRRAGITVRQKIGVHLDHLGRQQDGLVGASSSTHARGLPTAMAWPSAGRRRARRTAPASRYHRRRGELLHHRRDRAQEVPGICPTFSGLMASGSPSITSSTACGNQGVQIAMAPHQSCTMRP